jgi:hypothetical protein
LRLPPWSSADGEADAVAEADGSPPRSSVDAEADGDAVASSLDADGEAVESSLDADGEAVGSSLAEEDTDGLSEVDTRDGRPSSDGPDAASAVPPIASATVTVAVMMRTLRIAVHLHGCAALAQTTVPPPAISAGCGNPKVRLTHRG